MAALLLGCISWSFDRASISRRAKKARDAEYREHFEEFKAENARRVRNLSGASGRNSRSGDSATLVESASSDDSNGGCSSEGAMRSSYTGTNSTGNGVGFGYGSAYTAGQGRGGNMGGRDDAEQYMANEPPKYDEVVPGTGRPGAAMNRTSEMTTVGSRGLRP